jgi:hypothetical protein
MNSLLWYGEMNKIKNISHEPIVGVLIEAIKE